MLEPCKFPYLDNCQKRFLWTYKEVDLVPHPVFGLVLQIGDGRSFLGYLVWKIWIFFFFFFLKVRKQSQYFTATEEGGNDKRLVQLEFACEADDVA